MASFTTGDTGPALTGVAASLVGNVSTPVSLAGATATVLHIRWPGGAVLTKNATVTDAPNGAWSYTWQTGDLVVAGVADVELQVTFSNGVIQTFGPTQFAVQPQIA